MKAKLLGSAYNVIISGKEVAKFKRRWPCSGMPDKAITFQFSVSNGDLIDIFSRGNWHNEENNPNIDGNAVNALADDAQMYAEKRSNLKSLINHNRKNLSL